MSVYASRPSRSGTQVLKDDDAGPATMKRRWCGPVAGRPAPRPAPRRPSLVRDATLCPLSRASTLSQLVKTSVATQAECLSRLTTQQSRPRAGFGGRSAPIHGWSEPTRSRGHPRSRRAAHLEDGGSAQGAVVEVVEATPSKSDALTRGARPMVSAIRSSASPSARVFDVAPVRARSRRRPGHRDPQRPSREARHLAARSHCLTDDLVTGVRWVLDQTGHRRRGGGRCDRRRPRRHVSPPRRRGGQVEHAPARRVAPVPRCGLLQPTRASSVRRSCAGQAIRGGDQQGQAHRDARPPVWSGLVTIPHRLPLPSRSSPRPRSGQRSSSRRARGA